MKCNQSRPGFELVLPCPFPTTITITPRAPPTKIINNQEEVKLGQSTQEELNTVRTKIKNKKTAGVDEISTEVWKTRKFDDIMLRYCSNQNTIDR